MLYRAFNLQNRDRFPRMQEGISVAKNPECLCVIHYRNLHILVI
jgi:hypothetical protein